MFRILYALSLLLLAPFPAEAQVSVMPYACPKDIRICPDGSSVTRAGPECAFAPCPGASNPGGAPGFAPGNPGEGYDGEDMPEQSGEAVAPQPSKPMQPPPDSGDQVMCTMDAKICPDGTGVGRTGPNCEFAPCPGESDDTDDDEPAQDPPDDPEDEETDPY